MIRSDRPRVRVVALVGPPNAGKTSLYNLLTGSRSKTVNYPGATVDFSVGPWRGASGTEEPVQVVDTPGIVSVVPRSLDEKVAVSALSRLGELVPGAGDSPDVVLVAVDATQPARHLPLLGQVLDAGFRVVAVVTMNDLARRQGRELDVNLLSRHLGIPVVEIDGRTGEGMVELGTALEAGLASRAPSSPPALPESLSDERIREGFDRADSLVALCVRSGEAGGTGGGGAWLDRLVLHPLLGLPVFAIVMAGLFWSVFAAARPFMDLVSWAFGRLGGSAVALGDSGWAHLLADGVIPGFGAVLVFVPQIAILFLVVGMLEDSGYLARGAMLVDRFLMLVGLNGKSFVPLLSGNACAIPAALAARTIPGRRERTLTLLVIPLMSCSARLPVWGLLLSFLVPVDKAWIGGVALAGIYVASLGMASVAALVGGRLLRIPPSPTGFQVELPAWRLPVWRNVVLSAWERTRDYLARAGWVILVVSVVFWGLTHLPSPHHPVAAALGRALEPLLRPLGLDWRVGTALLASFAAREVFVSALAVVFSVQAGAAGGLPEAMRGAVLEGGGGHGLFTPSSVAGLVVFFMVSLQCMSTVAVMRREVSTRFALLQMAAFLAAGWILAAATVQGLRLAGVG